MTNQPKLVLIDLDVLNEVANVLARRPFIEVASIINKIEASVTQHNGQAPAVQSPPLVPEDATECPQSVN